MMMVSEAGFTHDFTVTEPVILTEDSLQWDYQRLAGEMQEKFGQLLYELLRPIMLANVGHKMRLSIEAKLEPVGVRHD